ncbi:MAG: hypothetical protein IIC75_00870 [Bacteroidetes bacterium]|nr:hypothetical protein [Bacteroidota bacterium]
MHKKILLLFFFLFIIGCSNKQPVENYKYVGTINSNIYHYPDCRWAKKITEYNLITFVSVEDAKHKGYRACKVCKPK